MSEPVRGPVLVWSVKQACVDCHFFVREYFGGTARTTLKVRTSEREKIRRGDYSWLGAKYSLKCNFAVWDEGHNFDWRERQNVIVDIERRGPCFFWKHTPGMLFPAAKTLQERAAVNREAARDRQLTIIGLWIAALALLVDAILSMVDKCR